jgi:hypothetical protein
MICRECGCTDESACLVAGVPCMWAEADLCSGCATVSQVFEAAGGLSWLLLAAAQLAAEREAWSEAAERFVMTCDEPADSDAGTPAGELLVEGEADWGAS